MGGKFARVHHNLIEDILDPRVTLVRVSIVELEFAIDCIHGASEGGVREESQRKSQHPSYSERVRAFGTSNVGDIIPTVCIRSVCRCVWTQG